MLWNSLARCGGANKSLSGSADMAPRGPAFPAPEGVRFSYMSKDLIASTWIQFRPLKAPQMAHFGTFCAIQPLFPAWVVARLPSLLTRRELTAVSGRPNTGSKAAPPSQRSGRVRPTELRAVRVRGVRGSAPAFRFLSANSVSRFTLRAICTRAHQSYSLYWAWVSQRW